MWARGSSTPSEGDVGLHGCVVSLTGALREGELIGVIDWGLMPSGALHHSLLYMFYF